MNPVATIKNGVPIRELVAEHGGRRKGVQVQGISAEDAVRRLGLATE